MRGFLPGAGVMSREWERGRLARIAGKPRSANPYGLTGKSSARRMRWLAGWLYQNERQETPAREVPREVA